MHPKQIIEKFGGQSALAKMIGKGQSTVSYWATAGVIPARWQGQLLDLARAHDIDLSAQDFVSGAEPTPAANLPARIAAPDIPALVPDKVDEAQESPFLFYAGEDGSIKVQVLVGEESVWTSQRGMSEIFSVDVGTISEHLGNVFKAQELDELTVVRKFRTTGIDGKNYDTNFYSLDAIISVGYRVSSLQATQFRRWATSVLKAYLIKGFVLNEDRLKQGSQMFGKDYFDELLEKIREIRASERRFYQKITDLYMQCSVDYDPHADITKKFYSHVQDKLHYAVHNHTAAELIEQRADASKPHMGLTSWKNSGKGGKVTKTDVAVGKNYLTGPELDEMNRLVSMYLDWAENFARRQKLMTMKDWIQRLDGFLEFNAYNVLHGFGKVSHDSALRRAHQQYEMFRIEQDKEYRSDFDQIADTIKVKKRVPKTVD